MTHINLDTQPEVIQQFVLALSACPEGAILEVAGRPVACIVAPPGSANQGRVPEGEWTEENNRRRCALLDQKYDHGLSPAEEAELVLLQDAMHRYVDQVAPLPLDAARFDVDVDEPEEDLGSELFDEALAVEIAVTMQSARLKTGIGIAFDMSGEMYFTQVFATPRPAANTTCCTSDGGTARAMARLVRFSGAAAGSTAACLRPSGSGAA